MGYYVKNRVLQSGSTGVVMPVGLTAERPTNPIAGMTRYNSSTTLLEFYNGTAWASLAANVTVTYTQDSFLGDGTTTVYTMSVAPSSATQIFVYVNGVYQTATDNYTVGGAFGTTLTFTSPPPNGIGIIVIHTST